MKLGVGDWMDRSGREEVDVKRIMIWGLAMVSGAGVVPAARAGSELCASTVQHRIAWDSKGSTRWDQANVAKLCQGAEDSLQPARCFERVMHRSANWAQTTRWQPKNALELCQGTHNAEATISCFEQALEDGKTWKVAIAVCRRGAQRENATLIPNTSVPSTAYDGLPSERVTRSISEALNNELARSAEEARKVPDCEESPDADSDGSLDIACGGDDCDDGDPTRFPGNVEYCDIDDHDEDCDPNSFGLRDWDSDGYFAQECCNQQFDGFPTCGLDCDDRNNAMVPGAQRCVDGINVAICGLGTKRCSTDGSLICQPQPNGTGICVPAAVDGTAGNVSQDSL